MYDWFSLCLLVARQSSSRSDESYFLLYPYTDSWCVLFTSNTSAQTSSMYRSPSLKKPISVALAAMNICATFCHALFPMQLPLSLQMNPIMLQCASSSGYIKSNFFRDEKLNMTVQMSSCPLRGIVMYTELVVSFNCDIYAMWESNICAPFLLCQSYPEYSFSMRVNRPLIVGTTGESICQVVFSRAAN